MQPDVTGVMVPQQQKITDYVWVDIFPIDRFAVTEEEKNIQIKLLKMLYEFMKDKAYLQEKWTQGAELAQRVSQRTLDKVMKKVGFVLK